MEQSKKTNSSAPDRQIQKRIEDLDDKQHNKKGRVPCLFCLERIRLEASTVIAVVSTTAAQKKQDDPDAVTSVAATVVSIAEATISTAAAQQ